MESSLNKNNVEDLISLTSVQEGMLFYYLKEPQSEVYNVQICLDIHGDVNILTFEKAWNLVVKRNEVLRTIFRWKGIKNPVQIVLKEHGHKVRFVDLSEVGRNCIDEKIKSELEKEQNTRFDLEQIPVRISLLKLDSKRFKIILSFHHILFDGWSNGIILKELFYAYSKLNEAKEPDWPSKPKFKQFIKTILDQDKETKLEFWKEYLKGFDTQTLLPVKQRNRLNKIDIAKHSIDVPENLRNDINSFLMESNITLAAMIYGIWGIILMRYNNSRDIVFGTTVSGRTADANIFGDVAGLFINTVPLRVLCNKDINITDYFKHINLMLREREEYENSSLVDIKKCSELKTQEELFDSIVVIENYPLDKSLSDMKENGLNIISYSVNETTNYDFSLVVEAFSEIRLNFIYNKYAFESDTVQSISEHFINILSEIASKAKKYIYEIEMISDKEKQKILFQFNNTDFEYERHKTIHKMFEDTVEKRGNEVAAIFNREHITYSGLNERANRVARLLRDNGVKGDSIVAICVERSIEMLVGIYSILKAGGAYLPIDPNCPDERIKYILEDSSSKILLTQNKYFNKLSSYCKVIDLNDQRIYEGEKHNLDIEINSKNLAYIIYTSGSTGNPKGVMIEHRAVINRLNWMQKAYPIDQKDVILQKTTYVFDVSVWELFWWAFYGASVVLLGPGDEKNPEKIVEAIQEHGVTTIHFVPSILSIFLGYVNLRKCGNKLKCLRQVFASGEALTINQVNDFNDIFSLYGIRLINLYGPTEATVDVSYYNCPVGEKVDVVPIGRPIDNTRLYIVDKNYKLQPVGVSGELCIAGDGLARGYLNRKELSEEKFVRNPFEIDKRMYRTGDLARWLPDGNIEYLGRLDHQVKIRGFRIELSEIENNIMQFEGIKEAVVVVKKDKFGDDYIAAYIVAAQNIEIQKLKHFLVQKLPEYMVPSFVIQIDSMPLTSNGKVDRKSLPEPLMEESLPLKHSAVAENEMEKLLLGIWQDILGISKINTNDNFFDIGGNSLKIIRVNSIISQKLKRELPISVMFRYTTIRTLAEYLINGDRSENQKAVESSTDDDIAVNNTSKVEESSEVAVIGMAGRFPGAQSIDEFWENLKNGIESITFLSDEELIEHGIDPALINKPNYVKAKGVLDEIDKFDAAFFGYSPREAQIMDPQLRLLHTCVWESLENAGYNAEDYGEPIGAFLGASSNFFWIKNLDTGNSIEQFNAMILNERDFFSTRIAYKLNLNGPAMTVQTACSTSLVAIGSACESILEGKCKIAVAGGVGVTYPVKSGYLYEEGMIFSPDGHCRAFDKDAKGTVGGNGVGIVILKKLEDALRDRDTIYAVVKGIAMNNDGSRKVGFTAPSIDGQAGVIKAAQKMAGIEPESVGYVEAHGTGTELGDVIEMEALKLAFNSEKSGFCRIGSVKTNVGHLDSASGVAGFIKTVLSLNKKLIPPSLNYKEPNSKIDFTNSPIIVNNTLTQWKRGTTPLRAGINSFGIGGTNVHAVLEEAPEVVNDDKGRPLKIVVLSAKTECALDNMCKSFAQFLETNKDINLADASYTLQVGRKEFSYRKFLLCEDNGNAAQLLKSGQSGKVKSGFVNESDRGIAFMFSGIGSQYINMGLGLYKSEPLFREEMDICFEKLQKITGKDFKKIIYPDDESDNHEDILNNPDISQPLIFVLEYSLARTLIKLGIKPDMMIGYSLGEYVAAAVSGVFSIEDGLKLIVQRGELISKINQGAMLSVPLPEDQVRPLLWDKLWISIVNGPSCVVSGEISEIEKFESLMREKRCFCIRVNNSHAVHSAMMSPIADDFRKIAASITLNEPTISYISNVTGTWIKPGEASEPGYWVRHMLETVKFSDGVKELLKHSDLCIVEVGPGRDLSTLIRHHISNDSNNVIVNLLRNPNENYEDTYYLYNRIGQLWVNGVKVNWSSLYKNETRYRIPLPTYPFDMRSYPVKISLNDKKKSIHRDYGNGDISSWFYVPAWKMAPLNVAGCLEGMKGETVLLFTDESDIGCKLTQELGLYEGNTVITVEKGQQYSFEQDRFVINHERYEDYHKIFTEFGKLQKMPTKIIYLWGLCPTTQGYSDIGLSEETLHNYFYNLLNIAKAFGNNKTSMYIVTEGIYDITGYEELNPDKSLITGPCKVIPMEYPNFKCKSIDINSQKNAPKNMIVKQIIEEINQNTDDNYVAYRGRHRWVQILEQIKIEKASKPSLRIKEGGTYFITGGLGGIGFTLAEYLAGTYKANLVLVGRSEVPSIEKWQENIENTHEPRSGNRVERFKTLVNMGAQVLSIKCDVAKIDELREAVNIACKKFGKINGVIHAAGVPDGRMIEGRIREMSESVLGTKVTGTILVDKVFEDMDLDFLFICSSLSSVTGALGQVAYCSANAFQDAFAQYRNRIKGRFTRSVNWDTWTEVGMAVDSMKDLLAKSAGMNKDFKISKRGVLKSEGIDIFERTISNSVDQVIVSVDDIYQAMKDVNLLENSFSVSAGDLRRSGNTENARPDLDTEYISASNEMEQAIVEIVQAFFGIDKIGVEDNFFDLGATSFDIIQINVKLKEVLNREIPILSMFKYPTVRLLAGHLSNNEDTVNLVIDEKRTEEIQNGRRHLNQRLQKMKRWEQDE